MSRGDRFAYGVLALGFAFLVWLQYAEPHARRLWMTGDVHAYMAWWYGETHPAPPEVRCTCPDAGP